jgi:excisionase family DNA binding protein
MSNEYQRPYSLSEAARALNISVPSARAAVAKGELEAFRIGKAVRVRAESIQRLLRPVDRDDPAA